MSEEIKVQISGDAVYKAVKNYLNNSETLKEKIAQEVASYERNGLLKAQIERQVKERLNSRGYLESHIKEATKTAIDAEIRRKIIEDVQALVQKALANSVILVPKA